MNYDNSERSKLELNLETAKLKFGRKKPDHVRELLALSVRVFEPVNELSAAQWAFSEVVVPPPQSQEPGPLSFAGREYCLEPLDDFKTQRITDEVLCFGSQTGKTTIFMAGLAWTIVCSPATIIWVLPNVDLARSFVETRWTPMVKATGALAELVPTGKDRFKYKTLQQMMGASVVNFLGSNSPANLASRPARVVIMDEVDKFDRGGRQEADAVNLAEQRAKSFANPKRIKSSTPTLSDGLIWQEFLRGDQRRWFVPCPGCGEEIVLIWSPEFTVFGKTGAEARVKWDEKAKLNDHQWDLALAERTAHAECPFCKFRIRDHHKTKMNRAGRWKPTAECPTHFVSRHLPSLYGTGTQTSFGKQVVRFLQAKNSMLGLQGFVNGELAEPWEHQDSRSERIEVVLKQDAEGFGNAVRFMSVDCQGVSPYFWAVVRDWTRGGHSKLVFQGSRDSWDEIRQLQLDHSIPDTRFIVDSGYRAADVYMHCLEHGALARAAGIPIWKGWLPSKGREKERSWRDAKTGSVLPYLLGTAPLPHRKFRLPLLEFNGDMLLDVLTKLRRGPKKFAGITWGIVDELVDEEYWRQMDAKVYKPVANAAGKVVYCWQKRSYSWPDHLLDCEIMQLAIASFHRFLPWGSVTGISED